MVSLSQILHCPLLSVLVTNLHLTVTLSDEVHDDLRFIFFVVILLDDFLVRNIGERSKLVYEARQE